MSAAGGFSGRCTLLSGGVGGAKLALGLAGTLAPEDLTIVANTGDDFVHLGLAICPDLDTLLYTLAGLVDPVTGWGRRDETWSFIGALGALGAETWFRLGDADVALHVERTRRLAAGEPLSQVVRAFRERFGVESTILPMSDDAVATMLRTDAGELAFQDYFVRRRAEPRVASVRFAGAGSAGPAPGVLAALGAARAIVLAPSNPYLSIDPILAVPGMRAGISGAAAPVVAVSPIVGGRALKGPTAKIMAELGIAATPVAIARHYAGLIDGLVIDDRDAGHAPEVRALGIGVATAQTVMRSEDDKRALARFTLQFAASLAERKNQTP